MREPIDTDIIYEVFERQMGVCLYCKKQTEFTEGGPHRVIPQALGGSGTIDNLVWCCNDCKPRIKGENRILQGLEYLRKVS